MADRRSTSGWYHANELRHKATSCTQANFYRIISSNNQANGRYLADLADADTPRYNAKHAGVVKRYHSTFPKCWYGFDSRRPLHHHLIIIAHELFSIALPRSYPPRCSGNGVLACDLVCAKPTAVGTLDVIVKPCVYLQHGAFFIATAKGVTTYAHEPPV